MELSQLATVSSTPSKRPTFFTRYPLFVALPAAHDEGPVSSVVLDHNAALPGHWVQVHRLLGVLHLRNTNPGYSKVFILRTLSLMRE